MTSIGFYTESNAQTVSGHKIQLGLERPLIVGQTCCFEGRLPDPRKIAAVERWPVPEDLTQVRSFLGLCGGIRIWVKGYSEIIRPLTELMRKDEPFEWNSRRQEAFQQMKDRVTSSPALRPIDYKSDNIVILSVDTSYIAVGFHLAQLDDQGKRRVTRYGSLPMNEREARYSQAKLELFGLFRALRHFRIFVIGVKNLVVETDAKYIKGMINSPDVMPSASMNRWIAGILLFHFELRHVPGKTHKISDGLSRRPPAEDDEVAEDENWLDEQLGLMIQQDRRGQGQVFQVHVQRVTKGSTEYRRWKDFSLEDQRMTEIQDFLADLKVPDHIVAQDSLEEGRQEATQRFISTAARFFLQKGAIYRRHKDGRPRRVILDKTQRRKILAAAHDGLGHRGVYSTRNTLIGRFWWPAIYQDVDYFVSSCHTCQTRSTVHTQIPTTVSAPAALFEKIYLDVMFMPPANGFKAIVAARDDLSGLAEGRALKRVTSHEVAKFLLEQVIHRYGCPRNIVTDNGSEARGWTERLLREYNIPQAKISAYNSRANGVVERGHFVIRESIIKHCDGNMKKWPEYVNLAFFADRITTRRQTGFSPFFLAYGIDPILPMDLAEWTYQSNMFKEGMTSEDLLAARMRQLERREQDIEQAAEAIFKSRWSTKERFEREYERRLQVEDFQKGALVLVRNMIITNTVGLHKKTSPRYLGPFVIERKTRGGSYVLRELDGALSRRGVAAFRLIPYLRREGTEIPHERLDRLGLEEDNRGGGADEEDI